MLCVPEAKNYYYISQGVLTIDKVNDAEEMKATDEAFDILNFSQVHIISFYNMSKNKFLKIYKKKEDKSNLFKLTAAIMHWGNSKWKQRPREEQAETDGTDEVNKVSQLLGVLLDDLLKGLLKPKIKVYF
jgi:myosin heavy chain 6/7